jgi:hypothetical protein
MRIARTRRTVSRSSRTDAPRLRAMPPPRVGPRSRASGASVELSTRHSPMARFSEPEDGLATSATTNDARARVAGSRTSFRSRNDAALRDRSRLALPLAGRRGRAEPHVAPPCGDVSRGPTRCERKARSAFRRRVPSSPRTAHPFVTRWLARRAEPLRAGDRRARRRPLAGPPPHRLPVPRYPAKGGAFVESRGAFDR